MDEDRSYIQYLASMSEAERSALLNTYDPEMRDRVLKMINDMAQDQNDAPAPDQTDELDFLAERPKQDRGRRPWILYAVVASVLIGASAMGFAQAQQPTSQPSAPVHRVQAPAQQTQAPQPTPKPQPKTSDASLQVNTAPSAPDWSKVKTDAGKYVGLVSGCTVPFPFDLSCPSGESGTTWLLSTAPGAGGANWLTAYHVVSNDTKGSIYIRLPGHKLPIFAHVMFADPKLDVAILDSPKYSSPNGAGLYPSGAAPWCGPTDATVGQPVALLGYPRAQQNLAMATGKVTGVSAPQAIQGIGVIHEDLYDAATIAGDSGGPVLNAQGCVLGMADAASATDPTNADFLPIKYIKQLGVWWK